MRFFSFYNIGIQTAGRTLALLFFCITSLSCLQSRGEERLSRVSNAVAVFSGLDKITGRITSFDVRVGETYQFGALQVTPRVCYTSPPGMPTYTDAFVEIKEITLDKKIRKIFSGWMLADSPGLNAVEHPIYDVWVTGCK